jgi:hypothetical protein
MLKRQLFFKEFGREIVKMFIESHILLKKDEFVIPKSNGRTNWSSLHEGSASKSFPPGKNSIRIKNSASNTNSATSAPVEINSTTLFEQNASYWDEA